MTAVRPIDARQAEFWDVIFGRVPESLEVQLLGVEYVETPTQLARIRERYPCPTVVDAGYGIFGAAVALVFVDDDTGRAVAYAPPLVVLRAALEPAAAAIRELRDGLNLVDAIASDQWSDARVTLERMQRAARGALERTNLPHQKQASPVYDGKLLSAAMLEDCFRFQMVRDRLSKAGRSKK